MTEDKDNKFTTTIESNDSEAINVSIEPNEQKDLTTNMEDLKDKNKFPNRKTEKGFVSDRNGSSIFIKEDGQITLASSKYSNYKVSKNGNVIETSFQSNCVTNRRRVLADEIIVNEHKLNPNFYEYTNFKTVDLPARSNSIIGNLTVSGTVLVKAWDVHLKRYMLIRRPYRGPLFYNLLNVPAVSKGMELNDPLELNEDILALSDKGYQVNALISDAKSLIGKTGYNRGNEYGAYGGTTASYGNAASINSLGSGTADPKVVYKFLSQMGYNDVACAGILGNFMQESGFKPSNVNSDSGAFGLAQWLGGRKDRLIDFAKKRNMDYNDAGVQLLFFQEEIRGSEKASRPEVLNKASTPEEAAVKFDKLFERSRASAINNRKQYAKGFYDKISSWK